MGRSGYIEDLDDVLAHGRWRAQVASAIRGKRGQAFLRELIADELRKGGDVCALGCIGAKRGLPIDVIDPEDHDHLAQTFGIHQAGVMQSVGIRDLKSRSCRFEACRQHQIIC